MACVPDTNTFSLNDVRTVLGLGSTASLSSCFSASVDGCFDILYKGSKDRLSNFRHYCTSITVRLFAGSYTGCVDHSGSDWSSVRGATAGTNYHDSSYAPQKCGVQYNGSTYYIRRVFAGFNLAAYSGKSLSACSLYLHNSYTGSYRTAVVLYGTQNSTVTTADYDAFTFNNFAINGSQSEVSNSSCTGYAAYKRIVVASASNLTSLNAYMGSYLKLAIIHGYDNANYSSFGTTEHNLNINQWAGEQLTCNADGVLPFLEITYS